MKAILYLLAPPLTATIGLLSFTSWPTALAFFLGIVAVSIVAVRLHEKHHRSEAFDDHLTDFRVERSREWLLKTWKGGDGRNVED